MKNLLFIAALSMLTACADDTQNKTGKISDSEVPAAVSTAFSSKYPVATDIKWEREKEDGQILYEAEFKQNDQKMEAFWDENGTFVREEMN